MKTRLHRATMILATAFLAVGLSLTAAHGAPDILRKTVQLTAGAADTIDLSGNVADLLVANPDVADVGTLRADRLYVVGRALGETNVLAFDNQGNKLADIAVRVSVNEVAIRDTLKSFFPNEKIDIKTVRGDIILTGTVSTPAVAGQVRDLAGRFVSVQGQTVVDMMKVAGEQQVMLKVKVIEAKRSVLREYGIETDYRNINFDRTLSDDTRIDTAQGTGLTSLIPFATGTLYLEDSRKFGPLRMTLQGMERDGLVNTLAEPNLTAISGESAGFLAGGEFPVPTGRDNSGNITLEFKRFGVSLNFIPRVLARDNISLQISTEVSETTTENSVTLVNTQIPGLAVRRAETTVQIGSGGTLMIAGLIKSESLHQISGFPGVKDMPILGNLFKSKSFNRDESEVIILVTPYLVEPYAEPEAEMADAAPRLPADVRQQAEAPVAVVPRQEGRERLAAAPAAAPLPAVLPEQESAAATTPLARSFLDNLQKVYGNKAPQKVTAGPSFGYIVD